jgi:hypothetical protein
MGVDDREEVEHAPELLFIHGSRGVPAARPRWQWPTRTSLMWMQTRETLGSGGVGIPSRGLTDGGC